MAKLTITLTDEQHAMLCDHAQAFGFASLSTAVADLILNYAEAPMDMPLELEVEELQRQGVNITYGGRA